MFHGYKIAHLFSIFVRLAISKLKKSVNMNYKKPECEVLQLLHQDEILLVTSPQGGTNQGYDNERPYDEDGWR